MLVIVMGVSGVGKTTLGRALAVRLGWSFYDADDYHPEANIARLRLGQPLTDTDRAPWLDRLHTLLTQEAAAGHSLILACSALKESYRARLRRGLPGVQFVYLRADPELIGQRLLERAGHFVSPKILTSQLETLEEPVEALGLDASQPLASLLEQAVTGLQRMGQSNL